MRGIQFVMSALVGARGVCRLALRPVHGCTTDAPFTLFPCSFFLRSKVPGRVRIGVASAGGAAPAGSAGASSMPLPQATRGDVQGVSAASEQGSGVAGPSGARDGGARALLPNPSLLALLDRGRRYALHWLPDWDGQTHKGRRIALRFRAHTRHAALHGVRRQFPPLVFVYLPRAGAGAGLQPQGSGGGAPQATGPSARHLRFTKLLSAPVVDVMVRCESHLPRPLLPPCAHAVPLANWIAQSVTQLCCHRR